MAKREEAANHGEDSFLDTIANLVGILIILVVLIGGQTKVQAEAKSREIAQQDIIDEALEPAAEADRLRSSAMENMRQLEQYAMEAEYRRLERDKLLEKRALAKADVEDRISKIDDKKRARIEKTSELEATAKPIKRYW